MNPAAVNQLIKERKSIFPQFYSGQVIEDAVVEQILENATWAPTHHLTQPWRFTVFTGEGLKKLADFQAEFYKQNNLGDTFDERQYDKLKTKPLQCSHIIAIGMERDSKESVPEIEEIEAVACAVQNMHLTCTAYGIGAYWGTGSVTYKKAANAFFGLGKNDLLLGFFFMGMPENVKDVPRKRKAVTEVSKWVR